MDQSGTKLFTSTGPQGHRGRMRGRLLADEAALADYEILEMLLFFGYRRGDTKPIAKGLINEFGSLSAALEADRAALARCGLPAEAIAALDVVREAATELAKPDAIRRPVIADLPALEAYLEVPERTAQPPGLSALLLNNRNQVLAEPAWEAEVGPGALTTALMKAALEAHATAAILVRNGGRAAPAITEADRALHAHASRAGSKLSVMLHDMVVLGRGEWVSLRQRGH